MPLEPTDIQKIREIVKQETADLPQYLRTDGGRKFQGTSQDLNYAQLKNAVAHALTAVERENMPDAKTGMVAHEPESGDLYHRNLINWLKISGVKVTSAAPTVTDDSDDGYSVGSVWIDKTNKLTYECVDAAVGAAEWAVLNGIKKDSGTPSSKPDTYVSMVGDTIYYFTNGARFKLTATLDSSPSPTSGMPMGAGVFGQITYP